MRNIMYNAYADVKGLQKHNTITGRVVIIHSSTDDFITQPSGNSGEKIACGKIIGNSDRMCL